ncbi:PASTA domain-containing protein [Angustibacter sp. Root456]|uniref:PASTA domain-containing protein n=1 Tax=Angustibacter sp. Root456 TaxID=1736539 RepID=UPI0006FCE2C2|nr:PASTA domain-containing protein [Angustibacter sp. Root456]KQX65658.1 hypothetical protein ASD06_08490 [Angustibacter sp. Root456]
MPDVRGLRAAVAQQVLVDAAIPVNAISTHDAPSAATPGVVVEQTPAFGEDDVSKVDLGIAVPVTMPDLAGKSQDEAVETLSGFGVGVSVAYAYSKDVTAGRVLSTTPAIGKRLGPTASITVATSGSTLPLSQVNTVAGGCDSAQNVAVNGHDYATALGCSTDTTAAASTTWVLSKTVDRLVATVGIADDEAPGASAPYAVIVDGKVVAKGTAAFGASTKIDVRCTGAIQLTIRVGPASAEDVTVEFGDAVVYGSDQGIARLAKLQ